MSERNVKFIRKEIRRQIGIERKRNRSMFESFAQAINRIDSTDKSRTSKFFHRLRWLFLGK